MVPHGSIFRRQTPGGCIVEVRRRSRQAQGYCGGSVAFLIGQSSQARRVRQARSDFQRWIRQDRIKSSCHVSRNRSRIRSRPSTPTGRLVSATPAPTIRRCPSGNAPRSPSPHSRTFISRRGLGLMALTPSPTLSTAWLTKTEASGGLMEQVTVIESPTPTRPSGGDMENVGGASQTNGAGT